MVRKNRMKSFRSRVSDHEADGAKTWSRWYRYQLMAGAQLHIGDIAEKVFGSASALNKIRARSKVLSMRKSLEKKTGQMLSCSEGTYSLINPKEKGKIYGVNSGLEAETIERVSRNTHTSHYFEAYHRSVEISIKHNPRMLEAARSELSLLGKVVKKAERDIVKRAVLILEKNNRKGGHR